MLAVASRPQAAREGRNRVWPHFDMWRMSWALMAFIGLNGR
jgi:hypothetical protein